MIFLLLYTKNFTIIKFFVHYLTSAFVTLMIAFNIGFLFYWSQTTWLTWKFQSFATEATLSISVFFTVLKLWQGLQNASLQYLQLTKNLLCQDLQAILWHYPHFNILIKFSFWNLSNSFFSMSVLKISI